MPGRVSQASTSSAALAPILTNVPRIFDQAQASTTNHQKNFVALYKIHTEAAQHTQMVHNNRGVKLVGERTFEDMFVRMLMCVLPLKKGTAQADRVVKFVGGYTKFVNEKAAEEKSARETEPDEEDEDEDTTASRFTAHLLRHLLKGFEAKDKNIRYRVLHTVAEMVSHLGEIDEEIYASLRAGLLERMSDREAPVRMHAAIALSKLCGAEDPSELEEGAETVLDVLVDAMACDSAPDVRRAILLNIPITPLTLPPILARTRDTDTPTRKVVYLSVLQPQCTLGGPAHPRALSIAQRELVVRNGLGDREVGVRAAAGALIACWVDALWLGDGEGEGVKGEGKGDVKLGEREKQSRKEDKGKAEEGVLALLKLFHLEDSTIAADALLSVFTTRVDIFENIEFGDAYWHALTPERAFLARVFVEHCKATSDDARLEAALPVVTALAFHIQEAYNALLEAAQNLEEEMVLRDLDEEEKQRREDERADSEFVIGEMLRLAVGLDYADEIGRRKMFQLVRDMLSQEALPESLVASCLDVLRKLSPNERDLIRVVVEIVTDLRDRGDDDEEEDAVKDADAETSFGDTPATVRPARVPLFQRPQAELSPEEQARADRIDLKCLSLCIGMLERVDSTFEENITLDGVLRDLIIPSVKRKEIMFRERGFVALGLCCLIARRLATSSLDLFFSQIKASPEDLKLVLIKSAFDMFMVQEAAFEKAGTDLSKYTVFLGSLVESETGDKVRALLCMGIAKLVLAGIITDDTAIMNLIMAYLSPHTADNQELRQCLTFFFPVFSYSSATNQERMHKIFLDTFDQLNQVRRDLDQDQEMVSAAQVAAMFVDWTDPLKLSKAVDARGNDDGKNGGVNEYIHLQIADDIMRTLLKPPPGYKLEKEDKKVLLQLLPKLHIPDTVDDDKIRTLKLLIHHLHLRRPLQDAVSNKAFTKFDTLVSEKFAKQLEDFNEEEYKKLEELKDVFDFLDEIIPLDEDEILDVDPPKKKGRKRRSESIASTSTENDRPDTPPRRRKSKPKAKRRRLSRSDDEDDDDDDDDESTQQGTPPPVVPTRTLPKRSATIKKPQIIEISSDDDEDEEDTPGPRKSRYRDGPKAKQETKLDEEINDLLTEEEEDDTSGEIPHDSIMDDSEDEEDEVNDLLAED